MTREGRHFAGEGTTTRPAVMVTTHGRGVASHAGSRLADLAEVTGLSHAFREALSRLRQRAVRGMSRARVLVDLAVMLSDGGEAISDLAVLHDQPDLFGPVASTAKSCRGLGQYRRGRLGAVAPSACGGSGACLARTDRNWAGVADHGRG
jgi:hypothetical protein